MIRFKKETELKDTEIGKIPKDWEVRRLKDVVDAVKGLSYRSDEVNLEGKGEIFVTLNNFLRGGGFKNDEFKFYTGGRTKKENRIKNKDLIIALTDMTSEAKVVGAPAIVSLLEGYSYGLISLDCAKLIPKVDISKYYLYSYLAISQEENSTFANGVNVLHLNLKQFLEHKLIPFPPPAEQSRIAKVLSWFDDLIENKKRQNKILEKTAMAIYKSWFVDFEPFKDQKFVYNEELDREIPEGWEVKTLGEIAKVESGGNAPQKQEYFINGKYPFVRVKHLSKGPCMVGSDFINDKAVYDYNLKIFHEGSVIIQKSGESLKEARVNLLPFEACVVNHLAVFDSHANFEMIDFIFCYLKETLNELIEGQSGTALPYLRMSDIINYPVCIPSQLILKKFCSLVKPLFQKIILNQKELMVLRKIRDALLPQLVFGKLRVEEL